MSKKLLIVESPTKAKTIKQFLGKDFQVIASFGHVRDLPKSKMGIDLERSFEPQYIIPTKAKKHVTELKKAAKEASEVYLATDEDREGEAIAWHIANILKLDPEKTKRIVFHEITKKAITEAVTHPRTLDKHLVDAQQARRVLDRIVGYELSPLLWKKVKYGLSAGRVQSVALRLIVEREEERKAFKKEEYWSITAECIKDEHQFEALLTESNGKKLSKKAIASKDQAEQIIEQLKQQQWSVKNVETKTVNKTPPPPMKTSTLQQQASVRFGMSAKQTMTIAQKLYEGKQVGKEGHVGLITYMRTDSLNLSPESIESAREYIQKTFGTSFTPEKPNYYKSKAKGAQEAHEAIRPTDPTRTPDQLKDVLDARELKIYSLIWSTMLASQMSNAVMQSRTIDISAGNHTLRASGQTIEFEGYLKVTGTKHLKESLLPELTKDDHIDYNKITPNQHWTQPPARYSEASLIKVLEEHGIGRPSTYAPTMSTIQDRGYVIKDEQKRFAPEEVGVVVTNLLKQHFPTIVDLEFTANVEEDFDNVAEGTIEWKPMIESFYGPFHTSISTKEKEIKKEDIGKTDKVCPECKSPMIVKFGRFGKFYACSNYPECKYTEQSEEEKALQKEYGGKPCPDCKTGKLMVKSGRFGSFLGCSNYPECKHIEKIEKSTGVNCPKCKKGKIVEKKSKKGRTFYACNQYPDCDFALWNKPTGETCPTCHSLLTFAGKGKIKCSNKECEFEKTADEA